MIGRQQISEAAVVSAELLPCKDRAWLRRSAGVRADMADNSIALAPDIAEIPRLIEWVEGCCRDGAVAGDTAFKVTLALEEAVANVIQHAFDGAPTPHRIEVHLD